MNRDVFRTAVRSAASMPQDERLAYFGDGSTMASSLFSGKVALVTGASSGIGRASALALAENGADVALNYFSLDESAKSAVEQMKSWGRRSLLFPVDVSDQSAVEKMVAQTRAELGRIDLLVCCAVYSDRDLFWKAEMSGFRRTIEVSMMGAYYVLRAVTKVMIDQGQGGSVVVVSSPHARFAIPSCMAYNMAKAANDQMARTAAVELLRHKIRVNIVHPGWTDTPGERKYFSDEVLQKTAPTLPLGRMARPEEIARGVVFLLDPASDYVTGTTLAIDGGSQLPYWSRRGTGEF